MIRQLPVLLLFPVVISAQALLPQSTQPQTHYRDTVFSPGTEEGSPALGAREKFDIHAYRMGAPRVFAGYLFVAGLQQMQNSPGQWGRGFDGFAKRYGTDLGVNAMREGFSYGLDTVTHEDPRFFRSEKTGVGPRMKDALLQVLVAHTDSGGRNFAYGNVLSAYGSSEIATNWLPSRHDSVGDGMIYGTLLLAGDAGRNAFREFWPDIRRKLRDR
ncbi:MAG: hypothetical protein JWO80_6219 [Bryobacterales bacterium]|nr:hypothetical protein [Bryobacterales bacterium]